MKRKVIYFVGKVSELRKLINDKKIINQVVLGKCQMCDRCGRHDRKLEVVGKMIVCEKCAGRMKRIIKKVGRLGA